MDKYQFIMQLIQFVIPPTTTLLAGYFGVKYGIRQLKEQKKVDIIEEQLNKFYSPLLAFHKELKYKGGFRFKVKKTGDKLWEEKGEQKRVADFEYVDKEIKYNNEQLEKELLPLYYKMIEIFRENYWLADSETQKYYQDLIEFVEMWKRSQTKSIDPDIIRAIKPTETKLEPFYKELEERTKILKAKILK